MGKLQTDISNLVYDQRLRDLPYIKIGTRLIEAGIEILCDEGVLTVHNRIAVDDADTGAFIITKFRENVTLDLGVDTKSMMEQLKLAADKFHQYATSHYAKSPPQTDKAEANAAMAQMCYQAIGFAYIPPSEPGEDKFADWKADFKGVEVDSAPFPASTSRNLLKALYEVPTKGFEIEPRERLNPLVELGLIKIDDVSDEIVVTAMGRDVLGVVPVGSIDLPVEVASVTGNIAETELLARYIDQKVAGIDKYLNSGGPVHSMEVDWSESAKAMARTLKELAREVRANMHLPEVHLDGRVIPYNEDRSTGIMHDGALRRFFTDVHERNVKAGWWTDIETGEPMKRNVGEMFILIVTELAEAYDAWLNNDPDDKLPHYPGLGVELGDLMIRIADFAGALAAGRVIEHSATRNPGDAMFQEIVAIANRYEGIRKTPHAKGDPETGEYLPPMDVAVMIDAKLSYNSTRADHRIENRLKADGKRT